MPPKRGAASITVDVDGVPCRATKRPKQTVVVIGTEAVNRASFDLKGAQWDDFEAPEAAVRSQARNHDRFPGIAAARASKLSTVPDIGSGSYSSITLQPSQPEHPHPHSVLITAEQAAADQRLFEDPQETLAAAIESTGAA